MSELLPAPAPLRESDYQAIEAAVMETEKGRWFLYEFARRNRNSDTEQVLAAITGMERLLNRERRPDADRIRLDIGEMKDAIQRTKLEIAQIKLDGAEGSRFDRASNELDAIVEQTEAATGDILSAAEKIQEMAWTMREAGVEEEICEAVDSLTTTIYTACSFQDLTGQRTQKVVHVLRYLEHRIDSMIEIWGMDDAEVKTTSETQPDRGPVLDDRPDAHLLNGPALAGQGVDQTRVDDLMFEAPEQVLAEPVVEVASDPVPADEAEWTEADVTAKVEPDGGEAVPTDLELAAEPAVEAPVATEEADLDAFAAVAEAMEQAIDALKEVSAAATRRTLPPDVADPFEELSRAERQALMS